jgi:hypothetical protein
MYTASGSSRQLSSHKTHKVQIGDLILQAGGCEILKPEKSEKYSSIL